MYPKFCYHNLKGSHVYSYNLHYSNRNENNKTVRRPVNYRTQCNPLRDSFLPFSYSVQTLGLGGYMIFGMLSDHTEILKPRIPGRNKKKSNFCLCGWAAGSYTLIYTLREDKICQKVPMFWLKYLKYFIHNVLSVTIFIIFISRESVLNINYHVRRHN